MGGCFVIFLKSIKGIFLQKNGVGGVFAKFENYLGTFLRWRGGWW